MKLQKLKIFNTAIYIRLSRDDGDKEESDSVGNQKKLLTEYIDKKDELNLYNIYIDDGYTGTNFHRPSFQKMIADIEAGKVNCVAVKDLSRFGRDYIETGRYLERYFPELGVRFISVTDGIDSMKQAYDMLLPIKNIFNEQYARDISRKIHATVEAKQRAGEFIGAFASYGYKKSSLNKNKLIIDEYAAHIVRRIFSLYIQGYGKQKIAKLLNVEGILSPAEYRKIYNKNYKSSCSESTSYWTYAAINKILHREIYAGNMVQGTKYQFMRSKQKTVDKEDWIIVEKTHEPIIDKDTWEKAQSLLKQRTREIDLENNKNIFSGFIKCGDCGKAMAKNMWLHADGSKVYSMCCGTYKRNGTQLCTPHIIPMEVLEKIILNDLKVIVQNIKNLKELLQTQTTINSKIKNVSETELSKIKAEFTRIKYLKKSIYEDYRDKLITKEEYFSYRQDYTKKETLYMQQIKAMEIKNRNPTAQNILKTPWIKKLLELHDIDKLDREIVVEMISQIKIYENYKIKIIYHFSNELENFFNSIYHSRTEG